MRKFRSANIPKISFRCASFTLRVRHPTCNTVDSGVGVRNFLQLNNDEAQNKESEYPDWSYLGKTSVENVLLILVMHLTRLLFFILNCRKSTCEHISTFINTHQCFQIVAKHLLDRWKFLRWGWWRSGFLCTWRITARHNKERWTISQ